MLLLLAIAFATAKDPADKTMLVPYSLKAVKASSSVEAGMRSKKKKGRKEVSKKKSARSQQPTGDVAFLPIRKEVVSF